MSILVGNTVLHCFKAQHADMLYSLINRQEVRMGMSDSAKIPYESHLNWVKENLIESSKVHLFMVISNDEALGVALIKNLTNDSAELGIMVADTIDTKKMLLTSKLLTGILFYVFHKMHFQNLEIRILPGNENSLRTAKKIGAELQCQDETYQYFLLTKTKYKSYPLNKLLANRYKPIMINHD
ncbi:GNAT family N-acetyltransferase [Pedobacter sp. MR2016-19]|uniref:GNAT family N-acetyltransferase n=1 Tax=Pedobacter sp. MR2016-19 TaxID=2780089 RepID=UPI00187673CC|nr:GNAT family protein [Pedobacter sp. MR2016-19]MBE5321369.1 GNAT family N-acetyltransferase [Pedobacter sp. MR2016-19]